jgi:SAM-dependent methyltransferase
LLYKVRYLEFDDIGFDFLEAQIKDLDAHIKDQEILYNQVMSILRWEANLPPPPPKHLQIRVVGKYDQYFIDSGMSFYKVLNRLLRPVGKELKDFQSILDYGCGCGRGIRGLATLLPNNKLYGTDIDGEAIAWLKNNYSRYAEFSVTPHRPPTVYKDQVFDFIFGVSVMTHLPEDMQFQWLEELSRITKPDGYVMLSTHGEKIYQPFGKDIIDIMETKGFLHYQVGGFNYGKSISLPDFYQTTFHTHSYILKEWHKYFDIIDIQAAGVEQGLDNRQDSVLMQKRL